MEDMKQHLKKTLIKFVLKTLVIPLAIFIGIILIITILVTTIPGLNTSQSASASSALDIEGIENSDFIVKTDEEGALPTLSKEQLKKAMDCLPGEQKSNALKFIDDVKEAEEKYKVNALFSMSIFRKESSVGTDMSGKMGHGAHYNLASVSGSYNGNSYDGYKVYPSFSVAIDDYANNIANNDYYFKVGKYSLKEIGYTYCPNTPEYPTQGDEWVNVVKEYMLDFYKSAGVEVASSDNNIDTNIDNADVKTIMNWTDEQAWKAITGTAYSSKPTSSQVSKNTMDSRMKTITVKIRTGKNSSKNQSMTVNKAIAPLWEAFFNDLYEQCEDFYIVTYDGAYVYRASTSGSSMSAHAFGCAIDINASISGNGYGQKPYTKSAWSKLTDSKVKNSTIYFNSPMLDIAHKYTIVNGSDWSNPNDAMHFSFIGDWSRSQAKSKFGK